MKVLRRWVRSCHKAKGSVARAIGQFIALAVALLAPTLSTAAIQEERIIWSPLKPVLGLFLADAQGTHQRPFMGDAQPNYNPSFSADSRWIVFTSERFGSADIFRVHPDASGLERLTDSPAFDDQAALSPDGRKLAFVSTREGGTANIWLLDIESRRLRNLTRNSSGNFRPSWSADGQWLAFSSDREMPRRRLIREWGPAWELVEMTAVYIVHPDGSDLKRLTALNESAARPRWSPDGKRVICDLVTDIEAMRRARATSSALSIDISTGAREPFPERRKVPEKALSASWSPDGTSLIFSREVSAETKGTDVTRSRDPRYVLVGRTGFNEKVSFSRDGHDYVYRSSPGSQILKIHHQDASAKTVFDGSIGKRRIGNQVDLSADGRRIAFAIADSPHPEEVGQIVVMNCDGSDFRVVTHDKDHDDFPSFSPDGSKLVYRVGNSNERQHSERGLRILSLTDGRLTKLTGGWDDFPTWSPDGDRIAFTGFETGNYELYTIRPDGSGLRQLTHTQGNDAHPRWSPDGRWIAFVSSRMGWKDDGVSPGSQAYGDLFVMRADGTQVRQLTDDEWEEDVAGWPPQSLDSAAINSALRGGMP